MSVSKDVPIPTPGTCKYVPTHSKRDFAGVTNVMDLEMERSSWVVQVGLL